jgi:acetyl-CoA acetyltransferase
MSANAVGPATSREIAVVGWAQTDMVRQTDKSETQLLMDVITSALTPLNLTRADIDFTCLGSCDYITGQAFSFVSNLDAIGAWPPKRDSHVEMDGAWALYEAWLRLQEGDIEIAVVTGSGRSSTGDPALIYPMEMDPYFLAPLGVDPLTFAALQARAVIAAGVADERSMAEVSVRSRGKGDVDTLLATDYLREPLHRHDVPPITDGAAAMVLATGPRARQLVERPAYIVGFDHRTECHNPSFRVLHDSPSTRIAAAAAGLGDAPVEVAELQAAFSHEELLLRTVLGLGDDVAVNPSGGALRSNPIMATGLCRIGYAADHIFGGGHRALAHATSGPCLQQNLICVLEGPQ